MPSREANSVVSCRIWPKLKLIQAFMRAFVTCKMRTIQSKMKALEWPQHFSHYKSMRIFPDAQGQFTAQSKVESGRMSNSFVIVTCKNEEDPIKTEGARVATTFYIDFSDAQGQLTLQSVVESGQISNSFKSLCMS